MKSNFRVRFWIVFLLFMSGISVVAQKKGISLSSWDSLPRFNNYFQEKVYLHFDKPYYVAGDKMWYRAYLVKADNLRPDTTSCAIYVELINSKDSLIVRQKIHHEHGVFDGMIPLSENIPDGIYTIRAYTNWMRNTGEDFFFSKQIHIGNSITSKIQSALHYNFISPEKVTINIHFINRGVPFSNKRISYITQLQSNKAIKSTTTNKDGDIVFDYNPNQIQVEKPFVTVYYQDDINRYEHTFILPRKLNYDVQFFPEGGKLISGKNNCIAFKAIQSDGLSTEITGKVYDKNDKFICDLKSTHLGMGKFYMIPDSNSQYYAIINDKSGSKNRYNLPLCNPNSVSLCITQSPQKNIRILSIKSDFPISEKDSFLLIGHNRGTIFFDTIMSDKKFIYIDFSSIRPGIVSFVLLSKKLGIVSERLAFVMPNNLPRINFLTDKEIYKTRENVDCSLKVTDYSGKPIQGSFSASITDNLDITPDSTSENIISTLLLSSDIKGYIENANLYFDPNFKNADEALDVLLMTQAWKRFDVSATLKGEVPTPKNFLEKGQAISGRVGTGLMNKFTKGTKVSIIASKINYFDVQFTDEKGRFMFSKFIFPDSTAFNINVNRPNGIKTAVEIFIDQDTFPEIKQSILRPELVSKASDKYMDIANKVFVTENGPYIFNLKKLEVVANMNDNNDNTITDSKYFFSQQQYVLQGAALERFKNQPLSSLIPSLPGLGSWNENIYLNNDATNVNSDVDEDNVGPQFSSDGEIYNYREVQNIDVNNLRSVELLKAIDNRRTDILSSYLIVLNFKSNFSIFSKKTPPNFTSIMPLGYARHTIFYQPKYEVDEIRKGPNQDLRTTLAWIPEIKTNSNGIANFKFYTADRPDSYNIIVEGVTPNGEPCRMEIKRMLFSK